MKKFISLLVAFAITVNFFCVQVAAADGETSGRYNVDDQGNYIEWRFENGNLHVSVAGTREMPHFPSEAAVPWRHLKPLITSYSLSNDCVSIGDYAFSGCENLTMFYCPNTHYNSKSYAWIGKEAFKGCTSIKQVVIDKEISEIGANAFEGCTGLEVFSVSVNIRPPFKIRDEAFKGCTSLTEIDLPVCSNDVSNPQPKVDEIGAGVFSGCTSLTRVNIECSGDFKTGIPKIPERAFEGCTSLTSFSFPQTVTSIGANAFENSGITSVTIPNHIEKIGTEAFKNCDSLTEVTIAGELDELDGLGSAVFNDCDSLTSADISGITKIGESMFSGDKALLNANIKLSDNLTSIGDSAFNGCSSFTGNFIVPNTVTDIADYAFNGCEGLNAVFIPDGASADGQNIVSPNTYKVKYAYETAVDGKQQVKITGITGGPADGKIDIPDDINGIPVKSVDDVDGNRDKVSENHNHNIVGGVCQICGLPGDESGTTTWIIKDGTLMISPKGDSGEMADYDETNLPDWYARKDEIKRLQIRDKVTRIGNYSFYGLELEEIVIPPSVTHIGNHAFADTVITGDNSVVWIPETLVALGAAAFDGSNVKMIFYPAGFSNVGSLPQDGEKYVLGSYVYNENDPNVLVTITQGEDLIGNQPGYDLPKKWEERDKNVVSKNCNHSFDSEYGKCTKCGEVIGGIIGKTGENASDPSDDKVIWYWSPESSSVYISPKMETGRTDADGKPLPPVPIADAEMKNFDSGDNKNPFYKLVSEKNVKVTGLIIESGVASIGNYAFSGLNNITSVNVPETVKTIGNSAFEDCRSINELTLHDGLTSIGARAFYNVNFNRVLGGGRTFIEIPESVAAIGSEAFVGCTGLDYIAYPAKSFTPDIFKGVITKEVTKEDGTVETVTQEVSDCIPQAFKLAYKTLDSDPAKVEVTEIISGNKNTLISMPVYICGKEVVKVDENYHDLVNKDACFDNTEHKHKDSGNKCQICGKISGDASEGLDGTVRWVYHADKDGKRVLEIWGEGGIGTMKDYSLGSNPPWHEYMGFIDKIELRDIRNIGDYAFAGALYLKEVEYPSDGCLRRIGRNAFEGCNEYVKIEVPDSVTELGINIIADVNYSGGGFTSPEQAHFITLSKALYDNSILFTDDNDIQAVVMLYEYTDSGRQITAAVLNNYAKCGRLTKDQLVYPVSEGHEHCFNGENICILCGTVGGNCGPLSNPEETKWALNRETGYISITGNGAIGQNPWQLIYQKVIKDVLIGNGVVSICDEAFKDCPSLSSVTFEGGSVLNTIGTSTFEGCTSLKSIEFPDSLGTIGENAFKGSGLSGRVIIPSNVVSIGENSFNNCGGLTALMIPDSYADAYRPGTPNINLSSPNAAVLVYSDDGTKVLGICVPAGNTNVEVEIPSEIFSGVPVTGIEGTYKGNVQNISKVILPETITSIGYGAFMNFGDTSLNGTVPVRPVTIDIPSNVSYIGESAFAGSAVTNVNIPAGVTSIPAKAFENCSVLETVTVPSTLTEIGDSAFASCNRLKTIGTIGTGSFKDTQLQRIGDVAFSGCSSLTKVVLPGSINHVISDTVFAGCSSLAILEVPERYPNDDPNGLNVSRKIVEYFDRPDQNITTVIVYREIDNVPQITSAVFGNDDNWQNRIKNENDVIDDWLIVWKYHTHCFNKERECVLCKQQGGKCGEQATWIYDKNRFTIIINSNGGDGVMWDMIDGAAVGSDDYNHYEEMWGTLKGVIQEVQINEGMTTIGKNAFKDCPNLITVHIPSTLKTIGESAFEFTPTNDEQSSLKVVYIAENSVLETISANAFKNCGNLKNIGDPVNMALPQTLKYIRESAFEGCSSLAEIVIPDNVTTIAERAFAHCVGLTKVKLPYNLTSFGKEAFLGCTSLPEVVVPIGVSGGNNIFGGCTNLIFAVIPNSFDESNFTNPKSVTLVKYAATEDGSARLITEVKPVPATTVTIPDYIMGVPVTEIGSRAFKYDIAFNQGNEPKIILPSTLLRIDDSAFVNCTWLKELTLPTGLQFIGREAFEGCNGLTEITIPYTVTDLGADAFHMCSKLESVTMAVNSGGLSGLTELKKGTFDGCSNLKYIIIPEGIRTVGQYAFRDCTELEYAMLPFSIRNGNVDLTAFEGCTGLAAVYAPTVSSAIYDEDGVLIEDQNAVISGEEAKQYKLRVAVYDQNHNVFKVIDGTSIDDRSTYESVLNRPAALGLRAEPPHIECFNIHNQCILCGDMGGKCGENAYWKLDTAGNLTITGTGEIDHDNVKYYGTWDKFRTDIKRLVISDGITVIDDNAFRNCHLISAELPSTLEEIGKYAFSQCIALTAITIPNSVISIGEGAFEGDITLRTVDLPNSISRLNSNTFKGCISLVSVKLPEDLRYVETGVFSGCTALTTIELPINTTRVSEEAFEDCTNLTYIVAPDKCNYTFNGDEFVNATYFKYRLKGAGVEITYARPGKNIHHLVVPREIAGYPVVAIGDNAFSPEYSTYAAAYTAAQSEYTEESGLISVELPDTMTEIGNGAFKDRTDIRTITFLGRVTTIGSSAFENCVSLETASLPDSVVSIGEKAFYNCASLKNIPIYEGLSTIGSMAFANCGFTRAFVIIPSTVSSMGTSVFGNIADSALIAIPQKLANRYSDSHAGNSGSYMFRSDNCGYVVYRVDENGSRWVTEGKLGNGQTTLKGFENYMKVASDHVHCLYKGFCVLCNYAGGNDCGAETNPDGSTNAKWYIDRDGNLHIEGSGAMKDYTREVAPWREYSAEIKNIIVHEGITGISPNAFTDCDKSASVTLPSTVRSIGSNAFMNNKSLTSVIIPEGVKVIPENAFKGCTALREIGFPKSLERIEAGAFAGCTSFKYIELPALNHSEGLYVDNSAFDSGLEYIAMPEGTAITAEAAPYNRFTYIVEPDGATVRIVRAQLGVSRGSDLKFPSAIVGKTVSAIGGYGYGNVVGGNNVSDIRIVTIPEGVKEIYANAFTGCENLTSLSLPESLQTVGENAFNGCNGLTELVFKNGLKTVGNGAFSGCGNLEIVKLPLGIESVGTGAFSDCARLDIIITPRNIIDNRGYTPSASLVYYERRADGYDYIAAAKLGAGKTNIRVDRVERLGVRLDIDNHEHCYNEGVCVLCNDDGGLCGTGVVWKVNGDTLEIKLREGLSAQADNINGEMYDFTSSNPAPWLGEYKNVIRKLIINEGVLSIGSNAFSGLVNLTDISGAFPSSITRIGENAFLNCTNLIGNDRSENRLDTIVLDNKISSVASTAFAGCTSIKRIILTSAASDLNVPDGTAVIKYSFISGTEAEVTKIQLSEGKKTDVPNIILGHEVIGVAKDYRRFVTENHRHYHKDGDNRCTICDMISGECGENTKWYIDEENKRLIIHGEGGIRDFNLSAGETAPWTQYAELFNDIIIREPVTSIGDNAFVNLGRFDVITLPPTVTHIGENVFAGTEVRRMYISSGLDQASRDRLGSCFSKGREPERVYYQVTDDRAWVDVTRIELPEGTSKISIPKTIYCIPVRSVAKDFRQYVEQDDGHEHDYGDEHGESECKICGKVSYNHIWSDGWNHNGDSHWHDCDRGDYDPIKDGNIDGSEYGDHDWKEAERREPTPNADGYVIYRCEVCGYEKREVLKYNNGGGDEPNPPVTGSGNGGGFEPGPGTTSGSGDTTNPPSPGNNGSGGNGGGNNGGGNNGGGNTTYIPQPWETSEPDTPPVTNPPTNDLPEIKGDFILNIEQGGDSVPAKIGDSTSNIIKAVLSEEEQNKLINGTSNVQLILSVTEGDGSVSLRDRAIISAALGEYKLGEYLDISLFKVVDGVRERITHTSAPLTITIDIPVSLRNSGRRFRVIRAHDGSAAVLRDLDNSANTVTISTDRFSPYAIAYTDSINVADDYDPPMPTGDPGISVFVLVTMAPGLTAVGMIYFNHASDVVVDEERRKKIAKLVAFGKKGKVRKYIAIGLIFLVTLYYQGLEGIQKSHGNTAND